MDIPQLVIDAAKILAPFLPYLLKGAKSAAQKAFEEAGREFMESAWKQAETLWEKVKPKAEASPETQKALERVAEKSEDKRADLLEFQFEGMFNEDPIFAEQVGQIIRAGDGNVIVGRDVNNSNIFNNNQAVTNNSGQVTQTTTVYNNPPQISLETEKTNKARNNYLKSLINFCNLLPLATLGDDKKMADVITLENVYINLDTDKFKEDEKADAGKDRNIEMEQGKEKTPISCMEAAIKENKLVLLGNAGSGKSSFVKNLIAKQASVLRDGKTPLDGFAPDLIPVYLELRKLSPRLRDVKLENYPSGFEKKQKLLDVMFEQIRQEAQERKATDFLPALFDAFTEGKILLVMDGLDEVPQKLRELVRLAVEAMIQLQKIEKIIITSRINAYTGQNAFPNFKDYKIAPLNDEKIETFAEEWYKAQLALEKFTEDQAKEKTADLARRAVRDVPSGMSGNPMMLTCIAIIHKSGRVFPEHRAVLYSEIVDILSNKWQEEKAGSNSDSELAEILKDKNRLRKAIRALAYETHRSNYEAGGDTDNADLSEGQAIDLLKQDIYFGNATLAAKFLEYIYQQSGLFISDGGEKTSYHFPHRQIQEYLAGCYLISQPKRSTLYLEHAAQGDFWSAPALLGAEEFIQNVPDAWELLLHLMYELCPSQPPATERAERALLWSGQIAVEFGNENILQNSGQGKDYLERLTAHTLSLFEKSKFLTPRERAEAGNTLAKLGDPRFDESHWHLPKEVLLGFVHIPAGKFLMGTKQEDIKGLVEKFGGKEEYYTPEVPQHKLHLPDYYMARYPVTVAQFKTFVEESGHKLQDAISLRGILTHPVVYVTWFDALAYCKWLNEKLIVIAPNQKPKDQAEENFWRGIESGKLIVALPSEAEWEKASRGADGRAFPWRGDFDQEKVNNNMLIGRTSAVGTFPLGKSPSELQDMAGNVWEWTRSIYEKYPYEISEKRENLEDKKSARVLRGGAYDVNEGWVRCAYRDRNYPYFGDFNRGFRVVVCVSSPISPKL